jgi:hypothetical protein
MKTDALALIVVEILMCRGSAHKIEADSRIKLLSILPIPYVQYNILLPSYTTINLARFLFMLKKSNFAL